MDQFAVVIPAFNEASTVKQVVTGVLKYCKRVYVINDGSSDSTATVVNELPVTLINNKKNRGKTYSLWKGMQSALSQNVDAIITLDADGQHDPNDIQQMIALWQSNPKHIIIGSRLAHKRNFPRKRYYANKFANFWISWAAGYAIDDSQSGFRIYPTSLLQNVHVKISQSKGFVFESEVLIAAARLGYKSKTVEIAAIYSNTARPSHFRSIIDILFITRMVAWKLLSSGLNIPGLLNLFLDSVFRRNDKKIPKKSNGKLHRKWQAIGADGLGTFVLSNVLILMTCGLSLVGFIRRVSVTASTSSADITQASLIIVLGMRLQKKELTQTYRQRLDRARSLITQFPDSQLLILGGKTGNTDQSEAEAGKGYLASLDVPVSKIYIEDKSQHTLENLRQARLYIDKSNYKQNVLITNRFHLERSYVLAIGLNIQPVLCAAEQSFRFNFDMVTKILKEACYLHWYYVGKFWTLTTANKKMLKRIT